MKRTLTEKEFFAGFMNISQDLTYAEVRMLYLLITEPDIIELPQQIFADRIQAHRRTISIGLKKLRKLSYIHDSKFAEDKDMVNKELGSDDIAILKHEKATAKRVIISSFEDYYSNNKKSFTVNEDFYSFILGDIKLPSKYRHNKSFVTETIKETYPEIRFHFDLKQSNTKDGNRYDIIRLVNSEIMRARQHKFYRFDIENLLQTIYRNFSIEEKEALNIIKSAFPKITITDKRIRIRKPYKAKQFE